MELVAMVKLSVFQKFREWLTKHSGMEMSKSEAAEEIENFVERKGGGLDWDDFLTIAKRDPEVDRVRRLCNMLDTYYPPEQDSQIGYCSREGLQVLRDLVEVLRRSETEQDDRILKHFIDDFWSQHGAL